MYSFALLNGPIAHLKHILSRERLPFTVAYLGSMIATLYFAIGVSNFKKIWVVIYIFVLVYYTN